jgi:von Willebrand factor type D domain
VSILPNNKPVYVSVNSTTLKCFSYSTCNKGHWNCEESECLGTCKIYGASHFETFDRRSFDFNGLCSYLLVQSQTSSVESFKISFTNNICGPEGVPCSRSVQISVGAGDSLESVVLSKGVTALSTKRWIYKSIYAAITNYS